MRSLTSPHVPLLLLILVVLTLCVCAPDTSSRRGNFPSFVTPNEIGIRHVQLPGKIADYPPSQEVVVLLHVFIARGAQPNVVRGHFFAEAVSRYSLTIWGQSSQPPAVRRWGFPVSLRELGTGASVQARAEISHLLRQRYDDLHYPVPFTATFDTNVSCLEVSVSGWLHMAEICLGPFGPSAIAQLFEDEQANGWAAWSVLAPFRSGGSGMDAYSAVLAHYVRFHVQVGFSGALLYATPSLLTHLLADGEVAALVQDGRLVLVLWDRFSTYQQVLPNQTYYDVPEQLLIINHALLAFRPYERTVVFNGDIDEFFVPQGPASTIQDYLSSPQCKQPVLPGAYHLSHVQLHSSTGAGAAAQAEGTAGTGPATGASLQELQQQQLRRLQQQDPNQPGSTPRAALDQGTGPDLPWGAINLERFNFRSRLALAGADNGSELMLWQLARGSLSCSPLHTYTRASPVKPNGIKALLRPGGIRAWHVHVGLLEPDHSLQAGLRSCGFVLHAVNMWAGRLSGDAFTHRRGGWKRGILPGGAENSTMVEYIDRCLPPAAARLVKEVVSR